MGVSTWIPRPPSNWQPVCYLFLRDTISSLVLGADRALHVRSPHTPLLYSQETGIATTYCDATSPASVEKMSLSTLTVPKGEPAKRAANCDAPGTRRSPAVPDSVPQAGRKNPVTPHPPTPPPPPSPPTPTILGCRRPSSWPRLPSPYLEALPVRHGVPGSRGAPASLAQAPAERAKRGAVLQRRARIETHVTCSMRSTRNTSRGGF